MIYIYFVKSQKDGVEWLLETLLLLKYMRLYLNMLPDMHRRISTKNVSNHQWSFGKTAWKISRLTRLKLKANPKLWAEQFEFKKSLVFNLVFTLA